MSLMNKLLMIGGYIGLLSVVTSCSQRAMEGRETSAATTIPGTRAETPGGPSPSTGEPIQTTIVSAPREQQIYVDRNTGCEYIVVGGPGTGSSYHVMVPRYMKSAGYGYPPQVKGCR